MTIEIHTTHPCPPTSSYYSKCYKYYSLDFFKPHTCMTKYMPRPLINIVNLKSGLGITEDHFEIKQHIGGKRQFFTPPSIYLARLLRTL